jgi:hypothetical protein
MSTELKTITGRYEIESDIKHMPSYDEATISATRFYGGHDNGQMLQLTIQSRNIAYVQLTRKQVHDLIELLQDAFDHDIYPSD